MGSKGVPSAFSPASAVLGAMGGAMAKPIESSSESDGILEQALQFGGVNLNIGGGTIAAEQMAEQMAPGARGDSDKASGGMVAQVTPLVIVLGVILALTTVFKKRR